MTAVRFKVLCCRSVTTCSNIQESEVYSRCEDKILCCIHGYCISKTSINYIEYLFARPSPRPVNMTFCFFKKKPFSTFLVSMENFFSRLKNKMFYGHEYEFNTRDELKAAIEEYIDYYNNRRIQINLKGLPPCEARDQALESK